MGKATKLIQLIGAYHLLPPLYCFSLHIYNDNQEGTEPSNKLRDNYCNGDNRWALVTGGSDGIGKH